MKKLKPSSLSIRKFASSLRDLQERHQLRRSPSGLGFAFADSIRYVPSAAWDEVTKTESLFLRRDVLQALEENGPENLLNRYALVFRDHQPVAAVAVQIVTVSGDRVTRLKKGESEGEKEKVLRKRDLIRRTLSPVAAAAIGKMRQRLLIAGNLLSWGFHGIGLAPGADHQELWPSIAEALYRIRRAEKLTGDAQFVMVKDLTGQQVGVEVLERFSYRPLETEPNMVLTIDPGWKSYEDYLSALDAKYRRNAKDQIKKLAAAGCRMELLTDLHAYESRLYQLYRTVHDHATVRLVTLPSGFLPSLGRTLGADFRCNVVKRGEEILGFVTSLRDGETAIAYYIGFDREAAGQGLPLYLRLLHSTVADAIDWGCKRLSLGRTALEPKAALGAKPEPMNVWLRHRLPSVNWMLRGLLGAVPHAEAPERNPFKGSVNTSK